MNNKGFTIVELLAVIVIIGIISTIGTVGVVAIKNAINERLLSSKIDILESGAVYWGQDNMVLLVKSTMPEGDMYTEYSGSTNGYAVVKSVNELGEYITKSDSCHDELGAIYTCVKNDVTNKDMGNDDIYIYVSNNRVYASYQEPVLEDESNYEDILTEEELEEDNTESENVEIE